LECKKGYSKIEGKPIPAFTARDLRRTVKQVMQQASMYLIFILSKELLKFWKYQQHIFMQMTTF